MKKIIAKEILILFSTTTICFLIYFFGLAIAPKYSFDNYYRPSKWDWQYDETKIKEYEKIDLENNISQNKNEKRQIIIKTCCIIIIILVSIIYPIRIIYYITKWCLNTLKQ